MILDQHLPENVGRFPNILYTGEESDRYKPNPVPCAAEFKLITLMKVIIYWLNTKLRFVVVDWDLSLLTFILGHCKY